MFCWDINKSILKSMWELKGSSRVGTTSTKRNGDGRLTLPDGKTSRQAADSKTAPGVGAHVQAEGRHTECGDSPTKAVSPDCPPSHQGNSVWRNSPFHKRGWNDGKSTSVPPAQPGSRRNAALPVNAETGKRPKKSKLFCFLKNLLFIKKLIMPSETGYRKYDP